MFVSLGSSCSVGYQLQQNHKRDSAYPFDWVRTDDLEMITSAIENNFIEFISSVQKVTESDKFPISTTDDFPDNNSNQKSIVMRNKYGIRFYHDFKDEKDYEDVILKYQRRIDRFIELIKSNKTIYFVRDELKPNNISQKKINEFINSINKINKDCNFKLIIIIHNPNQRDLEFFKLTIDNVRIINDKEKFGDWKRPNFDWNDLFTIS